MFTSMINKRMIKKNYVFTITFPFILIKVLKHNEMDAFYFVGLVTLLGTNDPAWALNVNGEIVKCANRSCIAIVSPKLAMQSASGTSISWSVVDILSEFNSVLRLCCTYSRSAGSLSYSNNLAPPSSNTNWNHCSPAISDSPVRPGEPMFSVRCVS